MPTNQAAAFIAAARTRLATVTSLPATRVWENERGKPTPDESYVNDALLRWDETAVELGVAGGIVAVEYLVVLHTPVGQGTEAASAILYDVTTAFRDAALDVNGYDAELLEARMDGARDRSGWLAWPLALVFFHSYQT